MRAVLLALGLTIGFCPSVEAQTNQPTVVDLIQLAEATRLARELTAEVWPGWEASSLRVVLVTSDTEFLFDYPRTPPGFVHVGSSGILDREVLRRPRQYDPGMLASFPAFGLPPVIVIGRPETTGKTSTEWVLTVLHEQFHVFQMSDPSYFAVGEELGISGGDESGMWMLNYPFPYDDEEVGASITAMAAEIVRLLRESTPKERMQFWDSYAEFLGALDEPDRNYLRFQLWKEGVARYVELRFAEAAAAGYEPSIEYAALPGFEPYPEVASRLRAGILAELEELELRERKREAFYAFGAGLALLLDEDEVDWKNRYQTEKYSLEQYAKRD